MTITASELETKGAEVSPEHMGRLLNFARETHKRANAQWLLAVKMLLDVSEPQCEHRHHRTKPEGSRDWRAVDNLMHAIIGGVARYTPLLQAVLYKQAMAARDCENAVRSNGGNGASTLATITRMRDIAQEASELEALVKAGQFILKAHFELVTKAVEDERGNTADLHYDRIIGMAEQIVASADAAQGSESMDDIIKRWKDMGFIE